MNKILKNKKAFSLIELSIVILIVGIVVAGVTQSSRLISAFKLSTARNITNSSPVVSIKDLALWLDSTSEKSFDLSDQDDGQQVDNWYDINPQATSARQPLYKTNTINNLPTIKFDGLDGSNADYMQKSGIPLGEVTQADQVTIFIAQKVNSSSDNSSFFITTSDGTYRINYHSPAGSSIHFEFGDIYQGTPAARSTGTMPAGFISNATISTLVRKSTNVGLIRVNGAVVINNTSATSTFSAANMASNITFDLGGISVDVDYGINSNMGEFIMFRRALKADEIVEVEKYLGKKWGITIS